MDGLLPRSRREVGPGAVHLPDWLAPATQQRLVSACREWARRGPGRPGMRATRMRGGVMSVRTVCLGRHWYPFGYSRTVPGVDGGPAVPALGFPGWLAELGRRAVADAYRDPSAGVGYRPDIALVNYYDAGARMGLHQDRDERSGDPVVSLSLGDACVFRFGNTENRNRPWTDLELCAGDLFVFGGPSRLAYHGVVAVRPGTGVPAIGPVGGRLNITLRVSGLD